MKPYFLTNPPINAERNRWLHITAIIARKISADTNGLPPRLMSSKRSQHSDAVNQTQPDKRLRFVVFHEPTQAVPREQ